MSKREVNLVAGAIAMIIAGINGAAFMLGLVVGAGFGLLLMTAVFTLVAGFIAHVEFGGHVE